MHVPYLFYNMCPISNHVQELIRSQSKCGFICILKYKKEEIKSHASYSALDGSLILLSPYLVII